MLRRAVLACLSASLTIALPLTAFAQPAAPQATTPQPAGAQTTPADGPDPVALRLHSNTILVGTIVSEDADTIVLDAGPLGKITLKTSDVAGRLDPALVAAVGAPPPPPANTPESGVSFFAPAGQVRWVKTIDLQGSFNSAVFEQGRSSACLPPARLSG